MDTTQNENISRWKDSLGLNEEADREDGHIVQPSQKPRDLKDEQTLEAGLTFDEYWASAPTSLFPPPFPDSSSRRNSLTTFHGLGDFVTPENDLTFSDLEMSWPASLNNGPTFSFDNESANIKDPKISSQSVPWVSHVLSSLSTGVEESISNRVPPGEAAPWDKSTSSSLKRRGKRPLKYEDRRQTGQTRSVGACIRCREHKIRCLPDPRDVAGDCLPCKHWSSFPCTRISKGSTGAPSTISLDRPPPAISDSGYGSIIPGSCDLSKDTSDSKHIAPHSKPPDEQNHDLIAGSQHNQGLSDNFDHGTVYSDNESEAGGSRTRRYINEFAEYLFTQIRQQLDDANITHIAEALPDLLKIFSIKLGYAVSTQEGRTVMYFVHKYRNTITQRLVESYQGDDGPPERTKSNNDGMSLEDKINLWRQRLGADITTQPESFDGISEEDEEDMSSFQYLDLIIGSTASKWLLGRLNQQLQSVNSATAMCGIKTCILANLPQCRKMSRRTVPSSIDTMFCLRLDLDAYMKEKGFSEPPSEILPKILCLTGSMKDAQAMTIKQYMCQTWPTTGLEMISIIQNTLQRSANGSSRITRVLPDKTRIEAYLPNKELILRAIGTSYSIAEIGEQLGWLASSLRTVPLSTTNHSIPHTCTPSISLRATTDLSLGQEQEHILYVFGYDIETETIARGGDMGLPNGQCWQSLFHNPSIVLGYPIACRPTLESGLGLEIPLDILIALADASSITSFHDKALIKGYSTMLIPVRQVDNMIIWHLLHNEDGSRISYIDSRAADLTHIDPLNLETCRHILGWCSRARSFVGAPDANYDIKWSGLGKPSVRHAWEKITISGGSFVNINSEFVIGKKEKPICSNIHNGYKSRLKFIAQQYVLLYDVNDRRAWLVDGLSALLHLVRASLEHDEKDVFNEHFLYKQGQLQEGAANRDGMRAAMDVLLRPENCAVRLYADDVEIWEEETIQKVGAVAKESEVVLRKKTTFYYFKDRVLEIFAILEKMIDHLNYTTSENGVGFRLAGMPKNVLEGFDFMDVATQKTPIRPHMVTLSLSESGCGWTDLARSLHAVTLFGKGFGDLIQPVTDGCQRSCEDCGYGSQLPPGKEYLGVSVSLLEQILATRGSTETNPWRLVDDIYWHTPGAIFEACQCSNHAAYSSRKARNRAQVLLSTKYPKLWARTFASLKGLKSDGAVMFCHNWKFPLRWGHQPPAEGLSIEYDCSEPNDQASEEKSTAISSTSGDDSTDKNPSAELSNSSTEINISQTPPSTIASSLMSSDYGALQSSQSGSSSGPPLTIETMNRKRKAESGVLAKIKSKIARLDHDSTKEATKGKGVNAGL